MYDLDARRMLCPIPVIKTQNKVQELAVGDILSVIFTDSGVLNDIPAWARINVHMILGHQDNGNEITITIMVGG
jgi:tRNA 2-thiouridine synthesizing protein A